jgi:hypothetical protein
VVVHRVEYLVQPHAVVRGASARVAVTVDDRCLRPQPLVVLFVLVSSRQPLSGRRQQLVLHRQRVPETLNHNGLKIWYGFHVKSFSLY